MEYFFYIVDISDIAQYWVIIYNMSMHATYYQMLQGFLWVFSLLIMRIWGVIYNSIFKQLLLLLPEEDRHSSCGSGGS